MVTAEELTVAIRSEGVGETQQDLEGVERAMDETADSAGDSAEELQGFSESFQGAMQAAVAALAIGAAGLLSQVPVLAETFAGLGAVVDAVAFQMDSVLRPVLSPITDGFFALANAIFEADGVVGSFIGVIATLGSILAIALPVIAKIGVLAGKWSSTFAGLQAIIGGVTSALSSAAATITGFISGSLAAAAAVGALIGTLAVGVLEVTGVLDALRNLGQFVGNALPSQVTQGLLALAAAFIGPLTIIGAAITGFVKGVLDGGLSEGVDRAVANAQSAFSLFASAWDETMANVQAGITQTVQAFNSLSSDLASWASDLASSAFEWGSNIVERLIDGIRSVIGRLRERLSELSDIAPGVSVNVPSFGGGGGGGTGGGGGSGRPTFGRVGGGMTSGGSQIDGRQLSESTGRYRSDPGRRRGL